MTEIKFLPAGRAARIVKGEAIDARALVRAQTTHLCLDSQFNFARLIVPIRIDIYDVPGRKSSRRNVGDLGFHKLSWRNLLE